jgi:tryptophan-rich sensory protein
MFPSWLVIYTISFSLVFLTNRLSPDDRRWFFRLKRPKWLTFERLIPFIWIFIFICGSYSAYLVWENNPDSWSTWLLMLFYIILELTILAYTPVMCRMRSLTVGTVIGAVGFILGVILMLIVASKVAIASLFLLPYILWSPIGTYVTWEMIWLNPGNS